MLGTLSSIQNFLNKEGFHEAAKALERECREQGLHLPAKENLLLSRELGRFSRSDSAREATGSGVSVRVLSPSRTRVCSLVPSTAEPVTRELKSQADPSKVISAPSRPAPKNQGNAWLGAAQPKASTIRMSPFPLQLRRQEEGQGGARCWLVAEAERIAFQGVRPVAALQGHRQVSFLGEPHSLYKRPLKHPQPLKLPAWQEEALACAPSPYSGGRDLRGGQTKEIESA